MKINRRFFLFNLPPLYSKVVVSVQDLPGSICLSICVKVYIVFIVRLVQIESNVDIVITVVQCLYYYCCCSPPAIDLFDKVSDLKTEQSNARNIKRERENETKGLLFCCSSFEQNNNGPLKETEEEEGGK